MEILDAILKKYFKFDSVYTDIQLLLSSKDLYFVKSVYESNDTCNVYIVSEQFFLNANYNKSNCYVKKIEGNIFISNDSLNFADGLESFILRNQNNFVENTFTKNIIKEIAKQLLFEYCEEIQKENIGDLIDEFITSFELERLEMLTNSLAVGIREEKMREIAMFKSNIVNYREEMMKYAAKLEKAMQIDNMSIKTVKANFMQEIKNIMIHKKVTNIDVEEETLCVHTVPLILTEPVTKLDFKLGSFKIKINLVNGEIRFWSDVLAESIWGDSPHPHVSDTGEPCLGTAEGQIADMLVNKHIYGVFITLLNYLETCDIYDSAGKEVYRWECLTTSNSEATDILREVCDYEEEDDEDMLECHDCGTTDYGSNMYFCENCNEWYCEDHGAYRDDFDGVLCNDCYDEWLENNPEEEGDR